MEKKTRRLGLFTAILFVGLIAGIATALLARIPSILSSTIIGSTIRQGE